MTKKQLLLSMLILGATTNIVVGMEKKTKQELRNRRFIDLELLHATNYQEAKKALKHGANINTRDSYGCTALHKLSSTFPMHSKDKVLFARALIKNGININTQNNYGTTAAHYAAGNCNHEILRLIYENGGNLMIQNQRGETPLSMALDSLYGKHYTSLSKEENDELLSHCQLTIDFFKEISYRSLP